MVRFRFRGWRLVLSGGALISGLSINAGPDLSLHSLLAASHAQTLKTPASLPPDSPWPALPLGGKTYRATPGSSWMRVDSRQEGLPPEDYVHLFPLPPHLSGILGYLIESGTQYKGQHGANGLSSSSNQYLVLRALDSPAGSGRLQTASVFYHFLIPNPLRDLHISADGRSIFWGWGYSGRNEGMSIYRWNLRDGQLFNLQRGVSNVSRFRSSPDGSCLGIVSYDDSDNQTYQSLLEPWQNSGDGWLEVIDTHLPFTPAIESAAAPQDAYHKAWPRYPDYTPAIAHDPVLKKYPYWRATNRASLRGLSWGGQGEVFYTHQPSNNTINARSLRGTIEAEDQYPSVWSATLKTKTNAPVLPRGYDAVPSPDGRFLAFFGWPLGERPSVAHPAAPAALWLFDRAKKTRRRLSDQNSGYLFWRHDSKGLVCVRFPSGQYEARVSTLSLDGQKKELTTLVVPDPLHLGESRQGEPAPLEFKGLSHDNRFLMVGVCEFSGVQGSTYSTERTLEAVDLATGKTVPIAAAKPPTNTELQFSWDWFDTSGDP